MTVIEQPLGPMTTASHAPAGASAAPAWSWWLWFWPALALTLGADLASKYWLFSLPSDTAFPRWIELAYNPGVAWGKLGEWPIAVAILTLVLIPLLAWTHWRHFRAVGRWENTAFGLILGGALGNGWDRLASCFGDAFPGVRDFILIDLKMVGIDYRWPNFNLADAAICIGFIMIVAASLIRPRAQPAAEGKDAP
jgi:signal peptidase II